MIAYPPGIALLWPGERVDTEILALRQICRTMDFVCLGIQSTADQASLLVSLRSFLRGVSMMYNDFNLEASRSSE